ncbi:T9SS type A sorting domain-containing protein [Aquimarina aggregata]|uniref:T9SS type A sorting domain-containing protein n=1 Tax=Aquimarina aggregata TaxID=1642818 RepID=UPI002492F757|nr:T9SS type A sorting domain-containing protein [Aquimarina aggregata]
MIFFLLISLSAFSQSTNPSDYYSPIGIVDTRTFNVNASDNKGNDTQALQDLINTVSGLRRNNLRGGNINIPAGTYFLDKIDMKSHVHLKVNPEATFVVTNTNNTERSQKMFVFGGDNQNEVVNASIESTDNNRKFTLNLRRTNAKWITPFDMRNTRNFKLSGINILDKRSRFQGVNLSAGKLSGGGFQRPRNGFIDNMNIVNADYGYGLIQMHAGKHIFFRNISGVGGITLRLESGFRENEARNLVIDDIVARNVRCTRGNSAVTLSPHSQNHGKVDIRNVTSNNCGFAIRITDSQRTNRGSFASNSIIRNVKCTLGNQALVKKSQQKFAPCSLRNEYVLVPNNNLPANNTLAYRGPSASAILMDASYSINFNPNTHISRLTLQSGLQGRPNGGRFVSKAINCNNNRGSDQAKEITTTTTRLYPNPIKNNGVLNIKHTLSSTFQVYDASGKLVITLDTKTKNGTTVINMKNLSAGLYLVKQITDNGEINIYKVRK